MSIATEQWKKWEGKLIDGKFRLQRWLGGSDHSGVFLTERAELQKAVVKLIPAENLSRDNVYQARLKDDAQLSRWAAAAKLSHPHLIRLFECGRCQIDDARLLYVVMEFAEENLAEILPLRALSEEEVRQMLRPAARALDFLHQASFVHGRVKPLNIMAVDNQLKISTDTLRQSGDRDEGRTPSVYDAPEIDGTAGFSPAADIWSLGATMVAVLTQNEPSGDRTPAVPETIPQPLREIVRQCLEADPKQRCTAADIVRRLEPQTAPSRTPVVVTAAAEYSPAPRSKRWILVPVIGSVLLLAALIGGKFIGGKPATPAESHSENSSPAVPAAQPSAPLKTPQTPVQKANSPGSVLQKVMPEVSRSAQNTVTGKVKINVRVAVDASGNVKSAKLVSSGVSQYFSARALAAAQRWKFKPPVVQGEPTGSEWILRFQFGRTSTQVFPEQIKGRQ